MPKIEAILPDRAHPSNPSSPSKLDARFGQARRPEEKGSLCPSDHEDLREEDRARRETRLRDFDR